MKLYLYDKHHDNINGQMELPENYDQNLLMKVIKFLEEKNILDDYGTLIIAEEYEVEYDEESELYFIEFK
jgi:hypothetical protein